MTKDEPTLTPSEALLDVPSLRATIEAAVSDPWKWPAVAPDPPTVLALLGRVEAAERALAAAEARIEAVRALHFSQPWSACGCCDDVPNRCYECGDDWPCPTIEALEGEQR